MKSLIIIYTLTVITALCGYNFIDSMIQHRTTAYRLDRGSTYKRLTRQEVQALNQGTIYLGVSKHTRADKVLQPAINYEGKL